MEEIDKKVDEIEQKPHMSFDKKAESKQQTVQDRNYLVTISDGETQINLGVIAPNIMIAVRKFADKYQNDFNDLVLLSLDIQEIEFIN